MEKLQYNIETHSLHNRLYIFFKRLLDISVSLTLLILLMPLLMLFSIIVLLFSGRPIFFKQIRTGLNNVSFTIWKYRTMEQVKGGKNLHVYNWSAGVPNDFIFQSPKKQRITKVGKIYRKLSIDELPQLINVLRGEMSIVGPRPEIPEITQLYSKFQSARLSVKPGLTGYAQINGRSIITHGQKIEYDHYYINNRSFSLDMKIILKTIMLVIRGKGAC